MKDIKDDVSNAGDVEVIAYACGPANQRRYVEPGNAFLGWHVDEATALVDRAHVTRLTAERDGLLAEVERLTPFDSELERILQVNAVLQSELTKARDALKYIEDNSDDEVACLVAYEAGTKRLLYTK